MIKFRCEACGRKIGVPEEFAGKRVACPSCKQAVTVRSDAEAPLAAAAAAPADVDPLMPDLDELEPPRTSQLTPPASPAAAQASAEAACPSCHKPVREGAALCINCGQPLKAGLKRQKTRVGTDRGGRGVARSAAGLVVAAIVAGVFSLIWVTLVFTTGYEIGFLAWAIGGLIGLVAGAIARNPSPVFGAMTATLALASIAGAKLIIAGLLFLASVGVNFIAGLESYSPEQQKVYHAVLDQMVQEGAFDGSQREAAEASLAIYFTGELGDEDMFGDDWEARLEAEEAIEAAVAARLESMSEEEQQAAVARARDRHPTWIEDHNLYLAVVDGMVSRGELPAPLARHAQAELVVLDADGDGYDSEYYEITSPRDQQNRQRELRNLVGVRIAAMTEGQRQAVLDGARQRHPRWQADEKLHFAVLAQLVEEGALAGEAGEMARADVASVMDGDWNHAALENFDWERMIELRGEATAAVNSRILTMSADERQLAIAAAEEAHPNWGSLMDAEVAEFRSALTEQGVGDTFGSALGATLSLIDLLWIFLAVPTAYAVAIKQAEEA